MNKQENDDAQANNSPFDGPGPGGTHLRRLCRRAGKPGIKETYMKVSGVVSKVQSGYMTVKISLETHDHLVCHRSKECESR